MGNSCRLQLAINPPEEGYNGSYVAGSKLSGTLYARTDEDVSGIDLNVCLTGKEDVMVEWEEIRRDSDGNENRIPRYSYSKRDIVRMHIPLVGTDSSIQCGEYAYPFEVHLPEYLPSSMEHYGGYREGYCRIVYKIKAEVGGGWANSGKEEVTFNVIARPPSSSPVPNFMQPMTSDINFCCCFPQGQITLGASVDDTRQGMGEVINAAVGCINESSVEIDNIDAYITEIVNWNSDGHFDTTSTNVVASHFQLTEEMMKRSKSEMEVIESENGSRSMKADQYRSIIETVRSGSNQVPLQLPHNVHISYHGSLITVSHTLTILVQTPSCSTNPTIVIPLQIVSPDSVLNQEPDPEASAPQIPDGWGGGEEEIVIAPINNDTTGSTFYGGDVVSGNNEEEINVAPFKAPENLGGSIEPSLEALLKELESSINARSTVQNRVSDDEWESVFSGLQPQDVVSIVKKVRMDFDQADVAVLLAQSVESFTCTYVVVIIKSIESWMRISFVQKLLPFCTDVKTNSDIILQELSEWERISTERDFENALAAEEE